MKIVSEAIMCKNYLVHDGSGVENISRDTLTLNSDD